MTIANLSTLTSQAPASDNGAPQNPDFWGKNGFSFKSLLDTLNPLQQLPGVSSIYRAATGDTISDGARLAGGALYGGPLGFAASVFNAIVQTQTGKDIGGNVIAMLQGNSATQVAQNTVSPTGAPPPTNQAAYNAYKYTQNLLA